jgi:hypothetical protein
MPSVLESLDPRFVLAASEPAASEQELDGLAAFFAGLTRRLPNDLRALLARATEVELLVEDVGCIRFWSPASVLEQNAAHHFQKYMPTAVAVGDDEGGSIYVFMDGGEGPGLYRSSFTDADPAEAVFIADSITSLLVRGIGRQRLFDWE